MALTINGMNGFETGGGEQATVGISGTPSVQSTVTMSGGYALQLEPGDRYRSLLFDAVASVDDNHVFGFGFRTSSIAPSAGGYLFFLRGGGDTSFGLFLEADGDLRVERDGSGVVGTITSPFTADTFHYIEFYIENTNTGAIEVLIDRVSELTSASDDYLGTSGTWDEVQLRNTSTGADFYFDDMYWGTGATDINDALSTADGYPQVFSYQKTDGGATEEGDALDTGTWALVSETPASTGSGNRGEYTSSAKSGDMITDSGTRSGPSGDSSITGTIEAAMYIWLLNAAADTGTNHYVRYGNNVDTMTEDLVTIGTSQVTIIKVSESATVVPTTSQYFQIGARVAGVDDLYIEEAWAMVLHVPSAGVVFPQQTLSQLGVGI